MHLRVEDRMKPIDANTLLCRSFETVVFAGGGNRCWWQAGFTAILSQHPCWQAKQLVGTSAGAGIATAFATGRIQAALSAAVERFGKTRRNVEWLDLLKCRRPFVLPLIYPDWIASFLRSEDLETLRNKRLRIEVAITRPLRRLPTALSTWLAIALYSTEKYWLKNFHGRLPHYLGFRSEYIDLAKSENLAEARTLLMAAAAAVPLTPTYKINGKVALDGGFYDNVPIPPCANKFGSTLVLLTRHRPDLPQAFVHEERVYIQPAKPVAATNMDCTNPANVIATYEQGMREARQILS